MSTQPFDPRSRPARGTGDILVTGGTGFIGQVVCRALAQQGQRFRVLVRNSSRREVLEGTGCWMVEGDLTQARTLTGPLEDVKKVVHLAALVRSPEPGLNRSVNVEGTRKLLEACSAAGVERIVALSSDSVLRRKRSPYAETKAEAETATLAWGREAGRSALVLRPPVVIGEGSSHLGSLLRMARLPVLPLPSSATSRCPVWVGDVASAVLAALSLEADQVPDRPIDLPGPDELSLGELVRAVARAGGRREPRVRNVPSGALRGLARLAGPRLVEQLEGLDEEVLLDPSLARDLLNWQPLGIEETLARSL